MRPREINPSADNIGQESEKTPVERELGYTFARHGDGGSLLRGVGHRTRAAALPARVLLSAILANSPSRQTPVLFNAKRSDSQAGPARDTNLVPATCVCSEAN